jgi:hypothetical protein
MKVTSASLKGREIGMATGGISNLGIPREIILVLGIQIQTILGLETTIDQTQEEAIRRTMMVGLQKMTPGVKATTHGVRTMILMGRTIINGETKDLRGTTGLTLTQKELHRKGISETTGIVTLAASLLERGLPMVKDLISREGQILTLKIRLGVTRMRETLGVQKASSSKQETTRTRIALGVIPIKMKTVGAIPTKETIIGVILTIEEEIEDSLTRRESGMVKAGSKIQVETTKEGIVVIQTIKIEDKDQTGRKLGTLLLQIQDGEILTINLKSKIIPGAILEETGETLTVAGITLNPTMDERVHQTTAGILLAISLHGATITLTRIAEDLRKGLAKKKMLTKENQSQ